MPKKMGSLFSTLFAARQEADYTDMAQFSPSQVGAWQERAEEFVMTVEAAIDAESGGHQ